MPRAISKCRNNKSQPVLLAQDDESDSQLNGFSITKEWWKVLNISSKDVAFLTNRPVCIFCKCSEDCQDKLGEFLHHPFTGLRMHYFCLLLASGLMQLQGSSNEEDFLVEKSSIYGFMIRDIVKEVKRASKLRCGFCSKPGASIGCVVQSCKKKFHFSCGCDNGVLSQFFGSFKSFCSQHRPRQEVKNCATELHSSTKTNLPKNKSETPKFSECPICLEPVQCSINNIHSLVTPCCCGVWLHRSCVQQQAYSSGLHFFRCPVCNDSQLFTEEMLKMGIYIPERDASWELAHDAYTDLLQRHNQCDKPVCLCPHGRDYNLKNSEWAVVLCDLCGSHGTHIGCDDDVDCDTSYHACDTCVGIFGANEARQIAVDMGVIVTTERSPRRSQRIRNLQENDDTRAKRIRLDAVQHNISPITSSLHT